MSISMPSNVPVPTVPATRPYRVRLEGGPAQEGEVLTVLDHALVDGRYVVRSAHGEGFWHLAAGQRDVGAGLRTAVFEPHPSASFTFPRR